MKSLRVDSLIEEIERSQFTAAAEVQKLSVQLGKKLSQVDDELAFEMHDQVAEYLAAGQALMDFLHDLQQNFNID